MGCEIAADLMVRRLSSRVLLRLIFFYTSLFLYNVCRKSCRSNSSKLAPLHGQVPNTASFSEVSRGYVDLMTKFAYVLTTMQLGVIPLDPSRSRGRECKRSSRQSFSSSIQLERLFGARTGEQSKDKDDDDDEEEAEELGALLGTPHPHIFVPGDSTDVFGAIKAAHTTY